ncbi:Rid family hydrolase [Hoeflea sp. CAU 1731]
MRKTIIPDALREVHDTWHFAPAVVARGMIYCSGIIGTSPDGKAPGKAALEGARTTLDDGGAKPVAALQAVRDPKAQFETAFEALASILGEAGAGLADIIELTSYHVDLDRHMETFVEVRDAYLSPPWPAWTAIGVKDLIVPGGLVELRAVALAPDG